MCMSSVPTVLLYSSVPAESRRYIRTISYKQSQAASTVTKGLAHLALIYWPALLCAASFGLQVYICALIFFSCGRNHFCTCLFHLSVGAGSQRQPLVCSTLPRSIWTPLLWLQAPSVCLKLNECQEAKNLKVWMKIKCPDSNRVNQRMVEVCVSLSAQWSCTRVCAGAGRWFHLLSLLRRAVRNPHSESLHTHAWMKMCLLLFSPSYTSLYMCCF